MALDLHFQEQIAETAFDECVVLPLRSGRRLTMSVKKTIYLGVLNVTYAWTLCISVVTFCGHLYCWLCIYKWIQFRSIPAGNPDHQHPQCPVCKAEVSQKTLIPLYGPGQATKPAEDGAPSKRTVIPQRPPIPRCGVHTHNSHPSQQNLQTHQSHLASYMVPPMLNLGGTTTNVLHTMIGEMVYARVFGNAYLNSYNLAGNSSLRTRRQLLHADRSLGRVYFFLFCCVVACLLLF